MRNLYFSTRENETKTYTIVLDVPEAGTKTAQLFIDYPDGTNSELAGAVDVVGSTATIVFPASFNTIANNGVYYNLQVSVDGEDATTEAEGTITVKPARNDLPLRGSLSRHKVVSAATTNATVIKAKAGQIYGIHLTNTAATVRYVKLYEKATVPNPATDVPALVYAIPAGQQLKVTTDGLGDSFANGIGLLIVGGAANTDATAVAANDVVGSIHFA